MPPVARWSRRLPRVLVAAFATVSASSCAEPAAPGRHVAPIYYGEAANGYEGVVMLSIDFGNGTGALCSGTLVAPRVVVTAKHCTVDDTGNLIPPGSITVNTGPTGGRDTYAVADIRRTDGQRVNGRDFAVLITEEEVDAEPYAYASSATIASGDPVTLVGYGQRDDGDAGRKYEGDNEIDQVFSNYFFTTGEAACHGDSGGPAFDANSVLVGVIVNTIGGWDGGDSCASGISGITRVDRYHDIVDLAIEDAWVCDGADAETCGDGRDNDCDHVIDDGCLALGNSCTESVYCATGDCRDAGQGLVCVQACTPGGGVDDAACPEGTYCDETACGEGLCMLGEAGALSLGAGCADDTECRSLTCAGGRCLRRCGSDAECTQGETCTGGGDGGCGGCTPSGSAAPFGAPCAAPTDCASGACLEDAFGSVCSTICTDACPDGFACGADGLCARPAPGGRDVGAPCLSAGDCASELCGRFGDAKACTDLCDPTHPCPTGLVCEAQEEGSVCTPQAAIEGQGCGAGEDCLTGLCGNFGDFHACTAACGEDDPCPAGFVCQDGEEGGYCRPLDPPASDEDGGGCGCRVAGAPGAGDAAWFVLVGLAAVLASIARRGRAPRTRKET